MFLSKNKSCIYIPGRMFFAQDFRQRRPDSLVVECLVHNQKDRDSIPRLGENKLVYLLSRATLAVSR